MGGFFVAPAPVAAGGVAFDDGDGEEKAGHEGDEDEEEREVPLGQEEGDADEDQEPGDHDQPALPGGRRAPAVAVTLGGEPVFLGGIGVHCSSFVIIWGLARPG